MANQDGLSCSYWLSLSFKTVVGVDAINHPHCVERINGVQGCLLVAANWRENCCALGRTANAEAFFVEIRVGLNLNFLTETNYRIATKNISWLDPCKHKYISWYWSLFSSACVESVGFVYVVLFDAEVSCEVAVNFLASNYDWIAWTEQTISTESPWNLLVAMLYFCKCWVER